MPSTWGDKFLSRLRAVDTTRNSVQRGRGQAGEEQMIRDFEWDMIRERCKSEDGAGVGGREATRQAAHGGESLGRQAAL